MSNSGHQFHTKLYWVTWGWLLVLTVAMILVGSIELARGAMISLLLVGMVAKASLIAGNFMHLRFEKTVLIAVVVLSIVFTSVALFAGIASDGTHVLNISDR